MLKARVVAVDGRDMGRTTQWRVRARPGVVILAAALVLAGCGYVSIPGAPGCTLSPADSFWRADSRALPVHARSGAYLASIGSTARVKADFGAGTWNGGPIGIPYDLVPATQPEVPVVFDDADESDPGPYPIPAQPRIEGGAGSSGDRHVLVLDRDDCVLYETWNTWPDGTGGWTAGSGAVWDLRSNAMRPAGWTSADAAGLPILPGLVRYEEVEQGRVLHAIRVTIPRTQRAYVWPASHQAGSTTDLNVAPMGTWLRLDAAIDPATFGPQVRPIVVALQTYGAVVADNGSALYLSGVPDERWDNDQLRELGRLGAADFDVVDAASLRAAPGSYQVRPPG